jgi:hypothetical protein
MSTLHSVLLLGLPHRSGGRGALTSRRHQAAPPLQMPRTGEEERRDKKKTDAIRVVFAKLLLAQHTASAGLALYVASDFID